VYRGADGAVPVMKRLEMARVHMPAESVPALETLAAHPTLMLAGFLVVCLPVLGEIRRFGEGHATSWALQGLLPGVGPHVHCYCSVSGQP
jgi:hypothetical protein